MVTLLLSLEVVGGQQLAVMSCFGSELTRTHYVCVPYYCTSYLARQLQQRSSEH